MSSCEASARHRKACINYEIRARLSLSFANRCRFMVDHVR